MPRLPRRQIPGGLYHVTTRGNRGQRIVESDGDCQLLIDLHADVVRRLEWKLHAYCVMPNHYHALVETPNGDISEGMQLLNGRYAQAFNRRNGYEGHLFERRFRGIVVESDWHLGEVTRYIVLNPVRAGLSRHAADWKWSSYRATVGIDPRPPFLCLELLDLFGTTPERARAGFAEFVAVAVARPP